MNKESIESRGNLDAVLGMQSYLCFSLCQINCPNKNEIFKQTYSVHTSLLCCYNTSYSLFQCSLHDFGPTTTISSGWLVIRAWEKEGQKMRALFCKTFSSCNRTYRKHFLSLLTESEQRTIQVVVLVRRKRSSLENCVWSLANTIAE